MTESEGRSGGHRLARLIDLLAMLLVLAALVALFGSLSRNFLGAATFRSVANQVPDLMVVTVGMTLVLVAGGIDLSVGSVLALAASVMGLAMVSHGWPIGLAVLASLGVGLACGLVNGLVSASWSVPSFIVTLGMLEVARGAAYRVTNSETVYIGPSVEAIARPIAGLGLSPALLMAVGVVVLGQVLLSRTVAGRLIVATGTNEEAVRLSGIDPRPWKVLTFALSGLLAGLGAVFQVSRLGTADPNGAIGLELSAIAAAVIGGTSLMGGRGSIVRSFLGVLIIAVLQTGLAQVGATEPTKRIITGSVIVLAVIVDVHRDHWLALISRATGRGRPAA